MIVNIELTKAGIFVPGCYHGTDRSCWLQPIVVSNKAQFREYAKLCGLNAFRGATQVRCVPVPTWRLTTPKPEY